LSIAVLVLATIPLVYGPWQLGGRGLFQGGATGAPVLEALLGALTLLFAAGAWLRARRVPPFPAQDAHEHDQHARADQLARGEADEADASKDLYG
ncbi:MAG: DUF1616 domain-containing protein, partial [Halobacteriales archaeon]|nr:DUF1616 domain-containing protein [Halobacteriales archaeon]